MLPGAPGSDYNGRMGAARKSVGARELKTRLGKYMRAVRAGASFVITERGEPLAELRPLPPPAPTVQSLFQRMADEGLLTPGTGEPLPTHKPIRARGTPLSEIISEDREDRF